MKRYMMILMTLAAMMSVAHAQGVDGVKVSRQGMERSGDYMAVNMDLDLTALDVESKRAVLLTPVILNGDNQVELPSIGIYGRNRYYYYVRNGESMLTGRTELSYRASDKPASVEVKEVVPYQTTAVAVLSWPSRLKALQTIANRWFMFRYLLTFVRRPKM